MYTVARPTIEIIRSICFTVSAADLHHLLHALSSEPRHELFYSPQILLAAPHLLCGNALWHYGTCVLKRHSYICYGEVGAVALIVRGMVGGALAKKRQVSSREVGEGVEHGWARRMVACRAKDLEDRRAKERVKKGRWCRHICIESDEISEIGDELVRFLFGRSACDVDVPVISYWIRSFRYRGHRVTWGRRTSQRIIRTMRLATVQESCEAACDEASPIV
jgi:hypothetical protein